ncbi:hypothetical protein F1B92_01955 [Campylobacter sp. FMV-PI01]|uniref:Glycosyltransferase RgtA/B/C/D-like domain-containing protein n=1 Tax=Campylobacter portucalensis TaxID=2608384 RepID=A0A6L5WFT9_9BACT|nr:hypothetical protein [Campylobacter portucalensis]MSN95968.1 hypothetical protein [Campylobacter portucalensis]
MFKSLDGKFYIFLLLFFMNLAFLAYAILNLSISYYEAKLFYYDHNLISLLMKISCKFLTQSDFGVKFPFLFLHFINSILMYKISKFILKRREDRLVCVFIYMFLPGVMSSAIVANMAGITIFFTLLFIYLFETKKYYLSIFILFITVFIDKTFTILFIGVFFYSIYNSKRELAFISFILLVMSFLFYGFETSGKPKSYFLDTLGVYAAVFSPFIFLFFVYVMYRIWVKDSKNLIWFISISSFCISLLLSLRQKILLDEFLPFCVISIPLLVKTFYSSYRIRLPKFRIKYKILAIFLISSLLINSILISFNSKLYKFFKNNPQNHFAYKFDIAKDLADKLKSLNINSLIVLDDELALRLKFYGIEGGGNYILSEDKIYKPKFKITINKGEIQIANFYIL